MPRTAFTPDRLLMLDENFSVVATPTRRRRRNKPANGLKRSRQIEARNAEDRPLAPIDSLTRTRNLIMAALRVWELRNGIHDYW